MAVGDRYQGYLFTLTAGRTGTAWLAEFLRANLGAPAIHEPLAIDDFGTNMPDIRTMRAFNDRGLDDIVRAFWTRKLAAIAAQPAYVETNHTLAKCGLIESLATSDLRHRTKVVILTRDKAAQAISHLVRADFDHATIEWQWYLSPGYRNLIVSPKAFSSLGALSKPLWYVYEMEARQHYYRQQYSGRVEFVDVSLEAATTTAGAAGLLEQLGHPRQAVLPPPTNTTPSAPEPIKNRVRELVRNAQIDAADLARKYIAAGRRLDVVEQQ
jgi:hypothetical protein